MKQKEIRLLFQQFEQVACVSGDVECWSARKQPFTRNYYVRYALAVENKAYSLFNYFHIPPKKKIRTVHFPRDYFA